VAFDGKLQELRNALGTHTRISRVQGGKPGEARDSRRGSVQGHPEDFLRMIVVHELAHLKEPDHGKAFYHLCCHLERDYHQIEFDVRVYLTYLEAGGAPLWSSSDGDLTLRAACGCPSGQGAPFFTASMDVARRANRQRLRNECAAAPPVATGSELSQAWRLAAPCQRAPPAPRPPFARRSPTLPRQTRTLTRAIRHLRCTIAPSGGKKSLVFLIQK